MGSGKTTAGRIAAEKLGLAQMQKVRVPTPEGPYSILVGAGLLAQTSALLPRSTMEQLAASCAVVTNLRVGNLHAGRVVESLRAAGFEPRLVEIPDGERFKTLETVRTVYDQLIDARLERRSVIFALGGGVVGDVAGFAAATFMRGVPFVQLPTTLLAMVDASIGGKVAVDHPHGKNLIGAFKQPLAIIADTGTLASLPDAELRAGMAEVVKHAVIGDPGLFELLENDPHPFPFPAREKSSWLTRAIQVKLELVARDPYEQQERAKLNLGHTFGHALEQLSNYEMRHGDAVAMGLVCAARLAARRNVCDDALAVRIEHLLRTIGLPTHVPHEMSASAIVSAMAADKKRIGAQLRLVLPRALGSVIVVDDVTESEITSTLEETCE